LQQSVWQAAEVLTLLMILAMQPRLDILGCTVELVGQTAATVAVAVATVVAAVATVVAAVLSTRKRNIFTRR
jgi:hypothetical protein